MLAVLRVDRPIPELGALPGDRIILEPGTACPIQLVRTIQPSDAASVADVLATLPILHQRSDRLTEPHELLRRAVGLESSQPLPASRKRSHLGLVP